MMRVKEGVDSVEESMKCRGVVGEKSRSDLSMLEEIEVVYGRRKVRSKKVRLVIWVMPNGKHKLFFSTKTSTASL